MQRRRSSAGQLQGIISRHTTITLDPAGAVKSEKTEERFTPVLRTFIPAARQFLHTAQASARDALEVRQEKELTKQFFQADTQRPHTERPQERPQERIWTRIAKDCNDLHQELLGQWTDATNGITTRRGELEDALQYYEAVRTRGPWQANANYCRLRQEVLPEAAGHMRCGSASDLPTRKSCDLRPNKTETSPMPSPPATRPASRSTVNDFIFKHSCRYYRAPTSRLNIAKRMALQVAMDNIRASPDVLMKAQRIEEFARRKRMQFLKSKAYRKVQPRPETPGERKDLRAEIVHYRRSAKQEMEGTRRVKEKVLQSRLSV